MQWKPLVGILGTLVMSAAGSPPALAATWTTWIVTYPDQAKVQFQVPSTWKSRRLNKYAFIYEPPSHYFFFNGSVAR